MKYEQTLNELREKRDFYAAAIKALEKIAVHELGTTEKRHKTNDGRGNRTPRTPEQRAAASAARKAAWDRIKAKKANGAAEEQPYAAPEPVGAH